MSWNVVCPIDSTFFPSQAKGPDWIENSEMMMMIERCDDKEKGCAQRRGPLSWQKSQQNLMQTKGFVITNLSSCPSIEI